MSYLTWIVFIKLEIFEIKQVRLYGGHLLFRIVANYKISRLAKVLGADPYSGLAPRRKYGKGWLLCALSRTFQALHMRGKVVGRIGHSSTPENNRKG